MNTLSLGKHHVVTLTRLRKFVEHGSLSGSFESAAINILEVFQQALSFDAAWVLKFGPQTLNIQDIYLHQFCQSAFSKYLDSYYAEAPVPSIRQIKNEGFVSKRGSDLIENATWAGNSFFQKVIKPLGLKYFITLATINEKREYTGQIVLWRSGNRNDFSTQDCFFVERTSIACSKILEKTKNTTDLENPEILRYMTKRSSPAVMVLGEGNKILYINAEAKNILALLNSGKKQLLSLDEEKFQEKLYSLKTRLREGSVFSGQPACAPFETFSFRGARFLLRGIPLQGEEKDESVMILIETISREREGLATLNGNGNSSKFTAREGAVLRLVSQGLTNKEVATDLGIGVHTVKDHVKSIMKKLGTTTRSGIVSKLHSRSETNTFEAPTKTR